MAEELLFPCTKTQSSMYHANAWLKRMTEASYTLRQYVLRTVIGVCTLAILAGSAFGADTATNLLPLLVKDINTNTADALTARSKSRHFPPSE